MKRVANTVCDVSFRAEGATASQIAESVAALHVAEFRVVAHEGGTMRMNKEKGSEGVVDSDLKVENFSNLYVCDLSVFPVSPPANPTLTLAALAIKLTENLGQNSDGSFVI